MRIGKEPPDLFHPCFHPCRAVIHKKGLGKSVHFGTTRFQGKMDQVVLQPSGHCRCVSVHFRRRKDRGGDTVGQCSDRSQLTRIGDVVDNKDQLRFTVRRSGSEASCAVTLLGFHLPLFRLGDQILQTEADLLLPGILLFHTRPLLQDLIAMSRAIRRRSDTPLHSGGRRRFSLCSDEEGEAQQSTQGQQTQDRKSDSTHGTTLLILPFGLRPPFRRAFLS